YLIVTGVQTCALPISAEIVSGVGLAMTRIACPRRLRAWNFSVRSAFLAIKVQIVKQVCCHEPVAAMIVLAVTCPRIGRWMEGIRSEERRVGKEWRYRR